MKDPKRFYTYAYLREDKTPYYIGKGEGRRAYSKHHRVPVPPKERILFLKKNLLEEDAIKHEKYLIKVLGRKDNGTGILRNLTDGGVVVLPETRRKNSEAKRGKNHPRYGVKWSEEYKKQMSERMRGRECPFSRRKHSEEEKEKRRQKMLGRRWWNDGENETCSHQCPGDGWVSGRINKSLSCIWEVISPGGIVYITNNLTLFCKEKFDRATTVLANVAYGYRKSYKGYRCRKLTKYEYA
jgi:hypothetical protein